MYICDSEKTLFINIVLRYIAEAGNRYILSLSLLSTFFSSSSSLLYIVLNDEFLPARVDFFRNIRSLASRSSSSSERFGAWVLLFSRFSCFCGPEKNEKKNNTQNRQQRAGKWALALAVCSVVCLIYTHHFILSLFSFFRGRNEMKKTTKKLEMLCRYLRISGYYFYNNQLFFFISSASSSSSSCSRLW